MNNDNSFDDLDDLLDDLDDDIMEPSKPPMDLIDEDDLDDDDEILESSLPSLDIVDDEEDDLEDVPSMLNDEDLDEPDDDIFDLVNSMFDDSEDLAADDLDDEYDLVDDDDDEDLDGDEPVVLPQSQDSILDISKFKYKKNKDMEPEIVRKVASMDKKLNRLKCKTVEYARRELVDIVCDPEYIDPLTNEPLNLSETKRKSLNKLIVDILNDIVPTIKEFVIAEQSIRNTLIGHHKIDDYGSARYESISIPDSNVTFALNDLFRTALGFEDSSVIPYTYQQLSDMSLYDIYSIRRKHDDVTQKIITLYKYYQMKDTVDLTESELRKLTYTQLFSKDRVQYQILARHYETSRNIIANFKMKVANSLREQEDLGNRESQLCIPYEYDMFEDQREFFSLIDSLIYIDGKRAPLEELPLNAVEIAILKQFCYVANIDYSEGNKKYTCGNCEEVSNIKTPFAKYFYVNANKDTNFTEAVAGINVCPHCGCFNTLAGVQLKLLKSLTDARTTGVYSIRGKLAELTKFMFSSYDVGAVYYDALMYGNFNTDDIDNGNANEDEDNEIYISELDVASGSPIPNYYIEALNRFRSLVNMHRKGSNKELGLGDKEFDLMSTEVVVRVPGEKKGSFNYQTVDCCVVPTSDQMENALKVMCTLIGKDYTNFRRNSIFSLINYLANTPLHSKLDCTSIIEAEHILNTLDNVEELYKNAKNGSEYVNDVKLVLSNRAGILGIDHKLELDELYQAYMAYNSDSLSKAKEEFEAGLNDTLNDIYSNAVLLGHIPISNIDSVGNSILISYILDDKVWRMINFISGLMVITHTAEQLFNLRVLPIMTDKVAANRIKEQVGKGKSSIQNAVMATVNFRVPSHGDYDKFVKDCSIISTAGNPVDVTLMGMLGKIYTASLNHDIFDLYNGIVALYDLDTATSWLLSKAKKLLSPFYNQAEAFVNRNGETDYDRINFYLSKMFSEEELAVAYDTSDLLRYSVLPKRDGETLAEYIEKYSNQANAKGVATYTMESPLYDLVLKNIVYFLGLKVYGNFLLTNVNNLTLFLTASEFLRLSLREDTLYWKELLRIDESNVNAIVNSLHDFNIFDDADVRRPSENVLRLLYSFFPTAELNMNVINRTKEWLVDPDPGKDGEMSLGLVDYLKHQYNILNGLFEKPDNVKLSPIMKEIIDNGLDK